MPPSAPIPTEQKRRIVLREEERETLALKAFELSQQKEYKSLPPLVRDAAEQSLPEHRRPLSYCTSTDQWKWFRDKLAGYARNPPVIAKPEPETEPEPEPEPPLRAFRRGKPDLAGLDDLTPDRTHGKVPAQFRQPEPESALADDQELTDWVDEREAAWDAERAREEAPARPTVARGHHAASAMDDPATGAIHEADEREEWAMISGLRRRREADRELLATIVSLRQAVYGLSQLTAEIGSLGTQIGKLRDDLKLMPAAIRASTVELIRTQESFLRATTPHHATATPKMNDVQVNGHLDTPAPVIVAPRKVRVVVVGYQSGHQTKGCEKEIAGRAVVTFVPADQSMPKYEGYDYIVMPKECPKNWREKAKHYYSKDRLVEATGSAQDVGRQIARLQPPRAAGK